MTDPVTEEMREGWFQEAYAADTCGCGAHSYGECGCDGYVEAGEFALQREVEYLRGLLEAAT